MILALKPGRMVGRYKIEEPVGYGGVGIDYRARDTQLGREVAIEEFLPSTLAARPDGVFVAPLSPANDFDRSRRRFFDEANALAGLRRAPAVVRVIDILEANNTGYVVYEIVPGATLADRLSRCKRLDPTQVNHILWPLLEGLEQVHRMGVVHRDINPSNIVLDAIGTPTLVNFGVARAAMADSTSTPISRSAYVALEQVISGQLGPWTDIYSLAATLYHAIMGTPPPSALDRLRQDTYEPLAGRASEGFGPGVLAGLDQALALRISDRPQSISNWRSILWHTGKTKANAPVWPPVWPPPESKSTPATSTPATSTPATSTPAKSTPVTSTRAPSTRAIPAQAIPAQATPAQATPARQEAPRAVLATSARQEKQKAAPAPRPARPAEVPSVRVAAAPEPKSPRPELTLSPRKPRSSQLRAARADKTSGEPARYGAGLWLGLAAISVLSIGGVGYLVVAKPWAAAVSQAAQESAKAQRLADQQAHARAAAEAAAAAARLQAQQDAQRRIEAERAMIRKEVEAELQQKADAQAAAAAEAKRAAEARDPKLAQAAETALQLSRADKTKIQAALTALGFNTFGVDGSLGPRSREMISAWQKNRGDPPTGFLTATQKPELIKEAAPTIAQKAADAQKTADTQKSADIRKTDGSAAKTSNSFDGDYVGMANVSTGEQSMQIHVVGGKGWGSWRVSGCGKATFALSFSPDGAVSLDLQAFTLLCQQKSWHQETRLQSNSLQFVFPGGDGDFSGDLTLTRQGS